MKEVTCESFNASKIVSIRNASLFQDFKMSHISQLDNTKFNQINGTRNTENGSLHYLFDDVYNSKQIDPEWRRSKISPAKEAETTQGEELKNVIMEFKLNKINEEIATVDNTESVSTIQAANR